MVGVADGAGGRHHLAQQLLPLEERQRAQVVSLAGEQVEGVEDRRQLHRRGVDIGLATQVDPLPEPPKARLLVGVKHDQLAVEDERFVGERADHLGDLREGGGRVTPSPVAQPRLAVAAAGDQPVAVVLQLEEPAGLREGIVGRLGQHQL